MSNYINKNTATQIASYEQDAVKMIEIIKNEITDEVMICLRMKSLIK